MLNTDQQQTVGVVGAGTMGRGIVQLFAAAGHRVHCVDAVPGAARDALDAVGAMFDTLVAKGRMDADAARLARGAMSAHDDLAGLADCTLVIEAIVEDLSVKRTVFGDLERIVPREAILATNTSSLMVSEASRHRRGGSAGLRGQPCRARPLYGRFADSGGAGLHTCRDRPRPAPIGGFSHGAVRVA